MRHSGIIQGRLCATAYVDALVRWRWLLIGLWLISVLLSGTAYVFWFQIDNSVGVWFRQDDPERTVLERFNVDFGAREWTFVLLETDSIYDRAFLKDLEVIGRRIEGLAHVERVLSIANVRDSEVDDEGFLDYRPLYHAQPLPLSDQQLQAFKVQLHANPIFADNLYRPGDNHHAVLLIQNDNLLDELAPYRLTLLDDVRQILDEYPRVRHYALAGSTVLNADKIIVIDKGRIAAEGTHTELIATSPIYQEIYDSQLGDGMDLQERS